MPTSHLQLTGSTRCDGQKFLKYLMARGKEVRPEDLQLIRDKNNPVDPNAVQVCMKAKFTWSSWVSLKQNRCLRLPVV